MKIIFVFLLCAILSLQVSSTNLETLYEWKYLSLSPLPSEYAEKNVVVPFNSAKAIPMDVDVAKDGRVFVVVIAKPDVAVSLTTVSDFKADNGALLNPYPNYSWYLDAKNCNNITNIRGVVIDKCNRLWAIDDGKIDRTQVCPSKLMAFDLKTDKLLGKYEMPTNVHENALHKGVLVNPVVKFSSCEADITETNVYIADSEGYALILFNGKEFRRLDGQQYSYIPSEIKFTIAQETFSLPGGIVPLDLEPQGEKLYFANLASRNLSVLNVNELNDVYTGGKEPKAEIVKSFFTTQPTALRWSKEKVLFAGLAESSIVCWKQSTKYCSDNIDVTVKDLERLQYIATLKIVENEKSEESLLALSNRLQKSFKRNRSMTEINYRIMKASVKDLLEGTKCQMEVKESCEGKVYETV